MCLCEYSVLCCKLSQLCESRIRMTSLCLQLVRLTLIWVEWKHMSVWPGGILLLCVENLGGRFLQIKDWGQQGLNLEHHGPQFEQWACSVQKKSEPKCLHCPLHPVSKPALGWSLATSLPTNGTCERNSANVAEKVETIAKKLSFVWDQLGHAPSRPPGSTRCSCYWRMRGLQHVWGVHRGFAPDASSDRPVSWCKEMRVVSLTSDLCWAGHHSNVCRISNRKESIFSTWLKQFLIWIVWWCKIQNFCWIQKDKDTFSFIWEE